MSARRPLDRVVVRAPAKINLHLSVGRLGGDGYHDLTTVLHSVSLQDELTAHRADALSVTVHGEGADRVPTDGTNLAARAVELIARVTGNEPHIALAIDKAIPVAGGCAGGSADAAAALVACDALWGTDLSKDELAALGAELGADVPFSLHGGTALGTGRGDRLTPVLARGSYSWVLCLADGGLSTPAVYGELDRRRERGPVGVAGNQAGVLAALRTGDALALGRALSNDLQSPAIALKPALARVLDVGRELGAVGGVVSGSGPTVALLAKDAEAADELAASIAAEEVCRAVRRADGPTAGARVVG